MNMKSAEKMDFDDNYPTDVLSHLLDAVHLLNSLSSVAYSVQLMKIATPAPLVTGIFLHGLITCFLHMNNGWH